MGITLSDCYNTAQFRRLAKARLPGPIFHYIDGAADDEVTYRRNTEAYEAWDLVPTCWRGSRTSICRQPSWAFPWTCPVSLADRVAATVSP